MHMMMAGWSIIFSRPSMSASIRQVTRNHHRINLAQFDTRRNLVGNGTASSNNVMGTAMRMDTTNPRLNRDDLIRIIPFQPADGVPSSAEVACARSS